MDDGQQDDRAAAPQPDGSHGADDQDDQDGSVDELQMFTGEAGQSLQPHRFDTSLPFAEQSAALARGELLEFLRPLEASRTAVENASVVLYELIRNGIDHGEPCQDHTLEVCWEVDDGELILRVTDCGTPSGACPPGREEACEAGGHDHEQKWREKLLRPIEPDALRGRGLHLVAALSDAWDVDTTEGGTTVSATIRLG